MKVRATAGCIIHNDGKVLLARRNHQPFYGCWCIPGGHIEYGETARQAAIREIKEEVGLDISPEFFGCYDEIHPEYGWHAVVAMFTAQTDKQPSIDPKEVKETAWFSKEDIKKLKLAFVHKNILEDFFR